MFRYMCVLSVLLTLSACSNDRDATVADVDYAANAARWAEEEFQPSTLTRSEQVAELAWFTEAAAPFRGMNISVVSETLTTHQYESEVLTRAFEEITGIRVTHDLIQEGDVIEKLQTQMQSGQNVYDAYVNDSDLMSGERLGDDTNVHSAKRCGSLGKPSQFSDLFGAR